MKYSILPLILIIIFACNRPKCTNSNPIFENYSIDSEEYKMELLNQVSQHGVKNLRFWFHNFSEEEGRTYMVVNIQNESLCTKGKILVKSWDDKLHGILQNGGKGYGGAELVGLEFTIEKDSSSLNFVYKDIIRISD